MTVKVLDINVYIMYWTLPCELCDLLQITRRHQSLDRESENAEEWRILAFVIDRLIFWLSVIVLVVVAVWMYVTSARRPDIAQEDGVRPVYT